MTTAAPTSTARVSRREAETLELLARGFTDREAGEALGISMGTVRVYRRRMAEKLGTRSLGPMILIAWRRGELDLARIA